jgi:hypothetical protein
MFPDKKYKDGPLNFLFPLLNFIFEIEVCLIPFEIFYSKSHLERCIFCKYFPNREKLKSIVETFTPYNKNLIFEGQLSM